MGIPLAHKDTLRSLKFARASLVRLGEYRSTWEPTLTEIGQRSSVESLSLSAFCDTPQDWAPGVYGRMMFIIMDDELQRERERV